MNIAFIQITCDQIVLNDSVAVHKTGSKATIIAISYDVIILDQAAATPDPLPRIANNIMFNCCLTLITGDAHWLTIKKTISDRKPGQPALR